MIIFLWSVYTSSVGIYNYVKYGNCNGPAQTGLCLLDPTGKNSKISEADVDAQTEIVYPIVEKDDPIIGNENEELTKAYLQYHKLLFELQENITENSFSEIAAMLGLNMTKFSECLLKEKYKSEVNADTLMGVYAGVTGTPTFFVNKQKIVGPKPFRTFKTIIDKELKK